jgi:ABC-type Fe3+-siderophore transport system permease subunit
MSLIIVSIATAVAVCFTGTIGFVGLVAPHIARIFVGSNMRYLIPCSAAVGGFMLIAADCIARNVGTTGLPVGVITALIGSPLFLYFLIKQKKSSW